MLFTKFISQFAVLCVGLMLPAAAQQESITQRFATRGPVSCKSLKEPQKGAPSDGQAADLFRCVFETADNLHITLAENVKVQVGKGRPYQPSEGQMQNIDSSTLVYPIRGSYDKYYCSRIGMMFQAGKNCMVTAMPKATGVCYRTVFGEWMCHMADMNAISDIYATKSDVAGPK